MAKPLHAEENTGADGPTLPKDGMPGLEYRGDELVVVADDMQAHPHDMFRADTQRIKRALKIAEALLRLQTMITFTDEPAFSIDSNLSGDECEGTCR
jgi:hypothetical protein